MEEEPRYITQLMLIQCDKGTMSNYINVGHMGYLQGGIMAGSQYSMQMTTQIKTS